jgi:hypothetical protein
MTRDSSKSARINGASRAPMPSRVLFLAGNCAGVIRDEDNFRLRGRQAPTRQAVLGQFCQASPRPRRTTLRNCLRASLRHSCIRRPVFPPALQSSASPEFRCEQIVG